MKSHCDDPKTLKLTVTTETAEQQQQLELGRLDKKRELKQRQYEQYVKPIYGSPGEKEAIRREHRQALLGQVLAKEATSKLQLKDKVKESRTAVKTDRNCIDADRHENVQKTNYLMQFRDENKKLMEIRAADQKRQKEDENRRERELLKVNPINWSNTLC